MTENESSGQTSKPPEKSQDNQNEIVTEQTTMSPTGRRQALRNVRRQLTDDELTQSGTQKMLLEMLTEAESENERLKSYVTSFHEVDKKAATLGEKLNADRSIEVFFGFGLGLGGAILGLSTFFFTKDNISGFIYFVVGSCLMIGACIGRAVKK